MFIKIELPADLVLIRSFPRSFEDLLIFGDPSDHTAEKIFFEKRQILIDFKKSTDFPIQYHSERCVRV